MTKRGKVLRDTSLGPGLLMIEGQQYRFSRAEWRSETLPGVGLLVDVDFDSGGKVHAITPIPKAQLTREAEYVPKRNWVSMLARIGRTRLVTAALLVAAWALPAALSMQGPFPEKLEFTFWQMLGLLNPGHVPAVLDGRASLSAGLFGLGAITALAGPFLPLIWNDRRALLGGLLPSAFVILVTLAVRGILQRELTNHTSYAEIAKTISLGPGVYVSILVSLIFVSLSAREWIAGNLGAKQEVDSLPRKAA